MINLTDYHLHLVLCPVDMRRGFRSLSALAGIALGVDVYDRKFRRFLYCEV